MWAGLVLGRLARQPVGEAPHAPLSSGSSEPPWRTARGSSLRWLLGPAGSEAVATTAAGAAVNAVAGAAVNSAVAGAAVNAVARTLARILAS